MQSVNMEKEPIFIQVLSAIPVLNYFAKFYHQVIPEADTRTSTWPLMSTPDIPVAIVLVYLFIVAIFGPFCMRYVKVPQVNNILVIYNSFVLTLNLWLGISLTWHISKAGYQLGCQKVGSFSKDENAISSLLWIFHCSKIIELIDTLFLVIKKKGNQLTFLHLYHHSTIVVATWIGVKFVPGGSSAVIAMVNSWIHVFMYFYYEMMVLRVQTFRNNKKYKKFVTILQIVQFLATIVHCNTALRRNCGYPRWILTWLLLYMISFLVLFVHFYVQTYCRKPKKGGVIPNSKTINELEENGKNELWEKKQIQNSAFSDDDDDQDVVASSFSRRGCCSGREKDIEGANTMRQEKKLHHFTSPLLPQTQSQSQISSTTTTTTTAINKDDNEGFMESGGDFDIVQWEALEESDVGISTDDDEEECSESDIIPPLEEEEEGEENGGDEKESNGDFSTNNKQKFASSAPVESS